MAGVEASAPREQGWARVLLGTAAFLLLARAPGARALLPIVDTLLLFFPVLAACFVAGWAAGGPGALAFVWTLMTAALFALPPASGSADYYDLARTWGLLVAACFGLLCLAGARGRLLPRALNAAGLAIAGAMVSVGMAATAVPHLARTFAAEFEARNAATATLFARALPAVTARISGAGEWAAAKTMALGAASTAIAMPLLPALLVLEALAACALAWSLYHRLSRVRLGPPLAALREFTFAHPLVWALVAGGALMASPVLRRSGAAALGANLVVLFGALFALRGAGVAVWFVPLRGAAVQAAAGVVTIALAPVTLPAAVGLGLTDSWFDWRGLARATAPANTVSTKKQP